MARTRSGYHAESSSQEINVAMLPFLASTLFHLGRVVLLDDGQGEEHPCPVAPGHPGVESEAGPPLLTSWY